VASIQRRVRNGKISYSVRYRDPAGGEHRNVFARKVDAQRWEAQNEAAKDRGAWVDPGRRQCEGRRTGRTLVQAGRARQRGYPSPVDLAAPRSWSIPPRLGFRTIATRSTTSF